MLYGGTSILGSYAQPAPTTTDAHLYALDPSTGSLRWAVVPRPGTTAIRGVATDSSGRVWALSNGTLTSHNPRNGDLMRTITLTADTRAGANQGALGYDPTRNELWALVQNGKLYVVDARTGASRLVLERPLNRLTVSPGGRVFVSDAAELLRIDR